MRLHARVFVGERQDEDGSENGLHWLVRLVAYAPVAAEACRLIEKLSCYDRNLDTSDSLGYQTEEMMEAHCVPAVVHALESTCPATRTAAACALAALIQDELGKSTGEGDDGELVTCAIELGAMPMLLAQAVGTDLAAATAALHALDAACEASPEAADIVHKDGFISTLVELMVTHEPSRPRHQDGRQCTARSPGGSAAECCVR